ncbi:MAG TPA: S46 family peptidase, partial [Ferruginibacter sp.]|nr:S46 family peptidase [Ferruginibacter sp.]
MKTIVMKRLVYSLVLGLILLSFSARADEGMWLPQLLNKLNENRMKSLGMKISAEDIYSINRGSLKDAVVSFGGFCTGEIISTKGLVLTNHHCGFDQIQNHSSLEHNYIRDGFWAMNHAQELPNNGLFVTFIVRIDDVTARVMQGVTKGMKESERQAIIDKNMAEVRKSAARLEGQDNFIRGFFEANQYYMFTTETYRDIRLVGAPPSSIGNFGKDTDNWVWPRHTGDFALFRIYASKENKPAEYSTNNIPFTPKRALNVSLSGVEPGDFTMVFGFPGRTNQYLHSDVVKDIVEVSDPAKIMIRDRAMAVLDGFMRKDELIKIQYASKYARISNAWKKWQGEVLGLKRTNGVAKKQAYERTFQQRVNENPAWKAEYGNLLNDVSAAFAQLQPLSLARDYYTEIVSKIELYTISMQLNSLVTSFDKDGSAGYSKRLTTVVNMLEDFYKEYNAMVDQKVFEAMMPVYMEQKADWQAPAVREAWAAAQADPAKMSSGIYNTWLNRKDEVMSFLKQSPDSVTKVLRSDATIGFFRSMQSHYQTAVQAPINPLQANMNALQRQYMQAQLEVMTDKTFYPDANSTMRVTYGQVGGYQPRNGVKYDYFTT